MVKARASKNEDFLVQNWSQTELGKMYDIYEEEGELVGQQYPTDTGPLDILAVAAHPDDVEIGMGSIDRYAGTFRSELGSGAAQLEDMCRAAAALGSPVVRCFLGMQSDRAGSVPFAKHRCGP